MYKSFVLLIIAIMSTLCNPLLYAQNKVKIVKTKNKYQFLINNKPTYIKGVGCGEAFGKEGENYLKMSKNLGANAVRTWGIDQSTQKYLDEAHKLGLYVNAGLWLNPVKKDKKCSYITDTEYQTKVTKECLDYVKQYKDHPAIITWNVGNEVFFFTKDEKERIAFAKFLNNLIKKIKKIDPDHPIIYTSAAITGLDYIVKYVPEVDIFGLNLYGGVSMSIFMCKKKLNRPVMVTEIGPIGPWDCKKDTNKITVEPTEKAKSFQYRNNVKEVFKYKDYVLGNYVFHLGETTQDSLCWWNINYHNFKKASFVEIQKLYKETKKIIPVPRIARIKLSKRKNIQQEEWIEVKTKVYYPNKKKLTYDYFCSTIMQGILRYYVNEKIPVQIKKTEDSVKIKVPSKKGIYRFYVLVYDDKGYADLQNLSIQVD